RQPHLTTSYRRTIRRIAAPPKACDQQWPISSVGAGMTATGPSIRKAVAVMPAPTAALPAERLAQQRLGAGIGQLRGGGDQAVRRPACIFVARGHWILEDVNQTRAVFAGIAIGQCAHRVLEILLI